MHGVAELLLAGVHPQAVERRRVQRGASLCCLMQMRFIHVIGDLPGDKRGQAIQLIDQQRDSLVIVLRMLQQGIEHEILDEGGRNFRQGRGRLVDIRHQLAMRSFLKDRIDAVPQFMGQRYHILRAELVVEVDGRMGRMRGSFAAGSTAFPGARLGIDPAVVEEFLTGLRHIRRKVPNGVEDDPFRFRPRYFPIRGIGGWRRGIARIKDASGRSEHACFQFQVSLAGIAEARPHATDHRIDDLGLHLIRQIAGVHGMREATLRIITRFDSRDDIGQFGEAVGMGEHHLPTCFIGFLSGFGTWVGGIPPPFGQRQIGPAIRIIGMVFVPMHLR